MATYRTPGVYVEEISKLPPSVAGVSTAIPAFIGCTEKKPTTDAVVVQRINTMLDYESLFGGAMPSAFSIAPASDGTINVTRTTPTYEFRMYYSLSLYFQNGGGPCYIVSISNYAAKPTKDQFLAGLAALEKEDEPTLILLTDAVNLDAAEYNTVCQQALAQCKKLGDRFHIIDIPAATGVDNFRNTFTSTALMYGAAYHPYLLTSLSYDASDEKQVTLKAGKFDDGSSNGIVVSYSGGVPGDAQTEIVTAAATSVTFNVADPTPLKLTISVPGSPASTAKASDVGTAWAKVTQKKGFTVTVKGDGSTIIPLSALSALPAGTDQVFGDPTNGISVKCTADAQVEIVSLASGTDTTCTITDATPLKLTISVPTKPASTATGSDIMAAWANMKDKDKKGFSIFAIGKGSVVIPAKAATSLNTTLTLTDIKPLNTGFYNQVKTVLTQQRVTMPPSPAIAGVYASVDNDRGVWKAPANVGLASVIGPTIKITDADQDGLNVDPTAGKSINAIRAFTGKGTLVWGARTLAGNDNEWRYVSVRRLFIMMEESIEKATAFAVFEPNDATTWLKVKAMIESYLYGLWQQGALVGTTPDEAYFVNVGIGKTMTPQDVLEGRMIVEVGAAAVRPAEFIILRFSHKMQQS